METARQEAPESEKPEPEAPESKKPEPEVLKSEEPKAETAKAEKPINGVRAQEAEFLAGTEADERTEKEAEETTTTEKETGEEEPPERYVSLWNRLAPAFAHRNPFLEGEALDAILITPRELHFFCCKNWSAARNSFIYHGYYNYHHLLFGKAIDGNFFLGSSRNLFRQRTTNGGLLWLSGF